MPTTESQGRTILVVEDEPQVRGMIRSILQRAGFSVLEAGGGAQAVALSQGISHPIDLAVIDLGMPGMGGFDLANWLIPERPSMKVLYISGMVDSVAVASLVEGAPHLIVRKPFTPEELVSRIGEILNSAPST